MLLCPLLFASLRFKLFICFCSSSLLLCLCCHCTAPPLHHDCTILAALAQSLQLGCPGAPVCHHHFCPWARRQGQVPKPALCCPPVWSFKLGMKPGDKGREGRKGCSVLPSRCLRCALQPRDKGKKTLLCVSLAGIPFPTEKWRKTQISPFPVENMDFSF